MEQPVEVMLCVRTRAFLTVAICFSWRLMTMGCVGGASTQDSFQGEDGEKQQPSWRLLTREYFTSELNQHEFALCIATLPWCGESRSLMKDIQRAVKDDPRSFAGLQLFFVHTNKDRLLGRVILGGSTFPSFTLFRYGTAYRYNGRRSTSSIMVSIKQGISVLRSDSVLLHIESSLELEIFADSMDKAVVLFDFCGWEHKLKKEMQGIRTTDNVEYVHGDEKLDSSHGRGNKKQVVEIWSESNDISGGHTSSEKTSDGSCRTQRGENHIHTKSSFQNAGHSDSMPTFDGSLDRNVMTTEQKSDLERTVGDAVDNMAECTTQDVLYCVSGNAFQDPADDAALFSKRASTDRKPAVSSKNKVASDPGYKKETFLDQSLCSTEEYAIFKAVYHNVSKLAANSILTPQRTRFAIVTNEEVTSKAGISNQGRPWLLMYLIHDFDRLPYCFDGVGEVEDFLSDHATPLVIELEGEGYNSATSAVLNDTPSVILFIDRMSNSPEIQVQSMEALNALRALSYHYTTLADNEGENGTRRKKMEGKERRISEMVEKVSAVHMEEHAFTQMVESSELLTLLRNANLETRSLQQEAGGHIFFELLTDQHQSKNNNGEKDALLNKPDILRAKLAGLDEKVRQSFSSGAGSFFLPLQVSDAHLWKQDHSHPSQTLGYNNDKDSLHESMFSSRQSLETDEEEKLVGASSSDSILKKDDLYTKSLLDDTGDATTDECVLCQTSVLTHMNPKSPGIQVSDMANDLLDGSVGPGDMMEKSCLGMKGHIVQHSDSIGSLSSVDGERSQPRMGDSAEDHEVKPDILQKESEMNPSDEEGHQQFVVDEDKESVSDCNGLGFFFVDGEDQMKEQLTRSKTALALVIIDPQKQAHYIFPSNLVLNVTSLLSFVDYILSGELQGTVISEPHLPPPRQPPRPPFVNRDFHEIHPVPRASVDSFPKLVTGFHETDAKDNQFTLHEGGQKESEENGGNLTESAWEKDVLILFTTPWCGFCKRMELVVRELYRSFQLVKPSGPINNADVQQNLNDWTCTNPAGCAGSVRIGENDVWNRRMDAVAIEPPVLLQMDCTLNDCSEHLREIFEEETYPAVVLFPARNKLSPVVYSGAPTVRGIYDFLKGHGTASNRAQKHEGDSLNEKVVNNCGRVCMSSEDVPRDPLVRSTSIKIGSDSGIKFQHESATFLWQLNSRPVDFSRQTEIGCVLLASDKHLGVSKVFENSIVLIVSTVPGDMVHGLIVNKPIAWKTVQGLDARLEELLKPAALGYGGPIVENHRPILALTHLQNVEEFNEVVPGVHYGFVASKGNLLEMIHTGNFAAKDFWFFLGYSSWTWHQLQSELAQELWQLWAFSDDLVNWPLQWNR